MALNLCEQHSQQIVFSIISGVLLQFISITDRSRKIYHAAFHGIRGDRETRHRGMVMLPLISSLALFTRGSLTS